MFWQYRHGRSSTGTSQLAFTEELMLIFPGLTREQYGRTYDKVRNGLYHVGLTKPGVALSGEYAEALHIAPDGGILVNPHRWPRMFRQHLAKFTGELRDPANKTLRANFEATFAGKP